jgi:CubicO group peptidase (beta-lactamase class C family)
MKRLPNKFYPLFVSIFLLLSCSGNDGSSNSTPEKNSNDDSKQTILDNGAWREAIPESVGMDKELLNKALETAIGDGTYTQGLVVIKDGKLISERYRGITTSEISALVNNIGGTDVQSVVIRLLLGASYGSRDAASLASSWSMAKSVLSLGIGNAINQGYIEPIENSASQYIHEWAGIDDDRAKVTIKDLLDMASGFPMLCYNLSSGEFETCQNATDANGGGNIFLANEQMSECIGRIPMRNGYKQPWDGKLYQSDSRPFIYSNCDSMTVGQILYRATGKDILDYSQVNIFSKIGVTPTHWWRDNTDNAEQPDGNRLTYCCLDTTTRNFAKLGLLVLKNGLWDGEQIIPASYIEKIKSITAREVKYGRFDGKTSYGLKFWAFDIEGRTIYAMVGFDSQFVMIDFENNMIIVRNSLYYPYLGAGTERKMNISFLGSAKGMSIANIDTSESRFPLTLPNGAGATIETKFDPVTFYKDIAASIK